MIALMLILMALWQLLMFVLLDNKIQLILDKIRIKESNPPKEKE